MNNTKDTTADACREAFKRANAGHLPTMWQTFAVWEAEYGAFEQGWKARGEHDSARQVIDREIGFTCERTGNRYQFGGLSQLIEAFLKAEAARLQDAGVDETVSITYCDSACERAERYRKLWVAALTAQPAADLRAVREALERIKLMATIADGWEDGETFYSVRLSVKPCPSSPRKHRRRGNG